jgi:DNA modification methylase
LATMRFIGCDSRAVYVKMALASFQKNNCPPNEQ